MKKMKKMFVCVCVLLTALFVYSAEAAAAEAVHELEYYELGNDKIASITKLVGTRHFVAIDTVTRNGVLAKIFEYSTDPNDHTQAANDVAIYFQYLRASEDFMALKSFDGLPYEGGVEMQFAKNSVDEGNIIILDIEYNSKGYKLIFRKGEGTLTRN